MPEQALPGRVTAIVPTCGRPTLLPLALDSIAEQRRRPDHLVVVDVGSASWSQAAAERFQTEHSLKTTYVASPPRTPPGAARNLGASHVKSGWIAFLDDDDRWLPDYLAAACVLCRPGIDLVATRIILRHANRLDPLPELSTTLTANDFLARNPGVTGSSLLIRAEAFHSVGGFDPGLLAYNDLDLMIRALDIGLTLAVNQTPLVEQLIHNGGQATTPSPERLSALEEFAHRYRSRMTRPQRRVIRRERHRICKRLAPTRLARLRHLAGDVVLTSPLELLQRAQRARRLGGRYR